LPHSQVTTPHLLQSPQLLLNPPQLPNAQLCIFLLRQYVLLSFLSACTLLLLLLLEMQYLVLLCLINPKCSALS
jgi:hypothetical protein